IVGSGHHDDRTAEAVGSEIVFNETAQLATALANERNHVYVCARVVRHHAEQRAFPHTTAAEDTDALPFAAGQQTIDRPHAGPERLENVFARKRILRVAVERILTIEMQRTKPVKRIAEAIQYAAEQLGTDSGHGRFVAGDNFGPQLDALQF